ncbi:hypothetical protein E2562_013447 [Oryza meyeriana var. granulata]|uniref:BTB domain-containing protein n=1 Tax=Oryza meyeriana var. granulata TaxID=110450 RepID=A0A6G1BW79_9ORYZ|nr:hypothetical protein E2562_013447 [Oryza meyeriana var. granulata]
MGASSSRARASAASSSSSARRDEPPPRHHLRRRLSSQHHPGSTAVAVRSSGHHVFEIHDYALLKAITPNSKSINSVSFVVGGHSWHLECYPNGYNADHADYLFVNPVLENATDELLNVQEEFEREVLVVEDRLTIRCDIVVITQSCTQTTTTEVEAAATATATAMASFVDVPPAADPGKHIHDLLSSTVATDVTFQVVKRRFTAHRSVLAIRSPVFLAEHKGKMKKRNYRRTVQIDGMEPEVFDALLSFIYTDSLPKMEKQDELAIAQPLLIAAERYDLERLRLICEDKLCNHVDEKTVINMLAFVGQHPSCKGLKKACFEFLVKSPLKTRGEIITTEAYYRLTVNCPGVALEFLLQYFDSTLRDLIAKIP